MNWFAAITFSGLPMSGVAKYSVAAPFSGRLTHKVVKHPGSSNTWGFQNGHRQFSGFGKLLFGKWILRKIF